MADASALRFAVLQLGARNHYAAPAALARAGLLRRLYTDLCADVAPARQLGALWPPALRPRPVQRMLGRRLPAGLPPGLVRGVPLTLIGQELAALARLRRSPVDAGASVAALARRDGLGGADALYSFHTFDVELAREARESGVRVVQDSISSPDLQSWLAEERERFPGVEAEPSRAWLAANREALARKCRLADLVVVASAFTGRAILGLGVDPGRVVEVPLGLDTSWLATEPRPLPGRVLFVGNVGLLKGSQYLAAAARLLERRRVACEVRVVGPCPPGVAERPAFRGPTYVGQVPRSRILDEFLRADVFVLPTLCDSFALAHLEALASGVPVITTTNCGSVVRDGRDGFVVPIRDPEALADRIERLVSDRALRARMSLSARERAREFTWARYGERLLAALARLDPPGPG